MNTGLKFSKKLIGWSFFLFNLVLFFLTLILSLQIGFLAAFKVSMSIGVLLAVVFALILVSNSVYTGIFVFIERIMRGIKK